MHSRLQHSLLGALAGLFFWSLDEGTWHALALDPRAFFALAVLGTVFFGAALAMLGEIGARKALGAAIVIAIPVALLGWWDAAGFGPERPIAAQMRYGLLALFVLATVPIPFAMVSLTRGRSHWANYPELFTHSWNIVVRYGAAWLFLGLVWLVLFLSSRLLESVDIDILQTLFQRSEIALPLSGAILGLGLAVVTELEEMISPTLILRLLRLLLPAVVIVVAVFLIGLVLRRMQGAAGDFPETETLLAMAVAAVTLISIGVEREDHEAVEAPVLRLSARGLALILPVMVAVAVWIEWQRIADTGWTPARVAEFVLTALLAGYGIGYALATLSGRLWMERVRRVNIAMALMLVAVALLWLTPLIAPYKIATRSQIALYEAGRIEAARLPIYAMETDWGLAGKAGVARLRELAETDPSLASALARGKAPAESETRLTGLREDIVLPPGAGAPPEALLSLLLQEGGPGAASLCLPHPDGQPSCALVRADFLPDLPGDEAMFVRQGDYSGLIDLYAERDGSWRRVSRGQVVVEAGTAQGSLDPVIAAIAKGALEIVPSGIFGLRAGGQMILPLSR